MDRYKNFSTEDFLQDEFFINWIKHPTKENNRKWREWLQQNPEMFETVDEGRNILLAMRVETNDVPLAFYSRIKDRIDTSISQEESKREKVVFFTDWLRIAAVLGGVIIAATVLFHPTAKNAFKVYKTGYSQTKKVVLADGSEVILNANSVLKSGETAIGHNREVWLKGEAFFRVKHIELEKGAPSHFIVHTNDVNVEVLGTSFNVNSIEADKTSVLLTDGKVRISLKEEQDKIDLVPNQLAVYDSKLKRVSVNKVSPGKYIGWMDHKYIFEKISVEDISKTLSNYYGKTITIINAKVKRQFLSGTLELQDEATLLKTLSALLGVEVSSNNNEIIIGSK